MRFKKSRMFAVICLFVVAILAILRIDSFQNATPNAGLAQDDIGLRLQRPAAFASVLQLKSEASTPNQPQVQAVTYIEDNPDAVAWQSEIVSLNNKAPVSLDEANSRPTQGPNKGQPNFLETGKNYVNIGLIPFSIHRVQPTLSELADNYQASHAPYLVQSSDASQEFSRPLSSKPTRSLPSLDEPVDAEPSEAANWETDKLGGVNDFAGKPGDPLANQDKLASATIVPDHDLVVSGRGEFVPDTSESSMTQDLVPFPERLASTSNVAVPKSPGDPTAALNANNFLMAEGPKPGAVYKDHRPQRDRLTWEVEPCIDDFFPDPIDPYQPYDPGRNMQVYACKELNANQRPLIELGRPWYQLGQLAPPSTILGAHNPINPQFVLFGDYRTAYAADRQLDNNTSQVAYELNLFWNLQLTSTERFTMFVSPLDNGATNTRYLLDDNDFIDEFDFDVDFGFFEGDLGAMVGGWVGKTLPFDLPFALGVMPLVVQNGVWMEDFFLGAAMTIPARNSARLDISNMDFTFFAGFDEIISDAFEGEDDAAKMWGFLTFIEAMNGYWEIDYAYLEDRTTRDRSYHNIGMSFSRRYGRFLSNSTRVIVNAGQSTNAGENTADGILLISENSLITSRPSSVVPYLNAWIGFDRPQSAARNANAGGVLRNTGILFESDGMTGFPTLDATANETYGAALGLNVLPDDFSQQLILEVAGLGVMGDDTVRRAQGGQAGVGFRYQLPLSNALIFRTDGIYGFFNDASDVQGLRMELRRKF